MKSVVACTRFSSNPLWYWCLAAIALAVVGLTGCGGAGKAAPSPAGGTAGGTPSVTLTTVVNGLNAPVDMAQPNDGTGRFFVVELAGVIRAVQNGNVLATPLLDITSKVTTGGEMGLLGIALDPGFAQSGRFFVHYDRTVNGQFQSVIAEYHVSGANPNQADPASERIVLIVGQPPFTNHKGGELAFGLDGFLYIGLGDGGSEGDPQNNGQNLQTALGKILRIDVNSGSVGGQYGIPADNPFASGGGLPEIWAYGFRNPFRFSFDHATGNLFVGDVGQDRFEEIDIVQRGGNFGWSIMEASHCFKPQSGCNTTGLILPIAEYAHSEGNAVIGGRVYHGSAIPELANAYVFGDNGSGNIWMLRQETSGTWTRTLLLASGRSISGFGQDQAGEIYVVDLNGSVLRLDPQ